MSFPAIAGLDANLRDLAPGSGAMLWVVGSMAELFSFHFDWFFSYSPLQVGFHPGEICFVSLPPTWVSWVLHRALNSQLTENGGAPSLSLGPMPDNHLTHLSLSHIGPM